MSTFGDYKSYKKYEPAYVSWKKNQDIVEAKRMAYLKQNPDAVSDEDIQRGQTLIRAIDIMDEYSQKRAEDTEVATEAAMGMALELLMIGGAGLGLSLCKEIATLHGTELSFESEKGKGTTVSFNLKKGGEEGE